MKADLPRFVGRWSQLQERLGVTRQALQLLKRHPDRPRDRDDSRKEVAAWVRFIARNGLRPSKSDEIDQCEVALNSAQVVCDDLQDVGLLSRDEVDSLNEELTGRFIALRDG